MGRDPELKGRDSELKGRDPELKGRDPADEGTKATVRPCHPLCRPAVPEAPGSCDIIQIYSWVGEPSPLI